MLAKLVLSIEVKYNPSEQQLEQAWLDFHHSSAECDGIVVTIPVGEYDDKGLDGTYRTMHALLAYRLHTGDHCHYLRHIRLRMKKGEDRNQNLAKLFSPELFVELFRKPSGQQLRVNEDVLPAANLTILVPDSQHLTGYQKASDELLKAIWKGIDVDKGTFRACSFVGPLYADDAPPESQVLRSGDESPLAVAAGLSESDSPPEADELSPEAVYRNIVGEIEKTLNRRPEVAKFLVRFTRGALEWHGERSKLSAGVKSRQFKLNSLLSEIVDALDDFPDVPRDWQALGEVAGGFVVLGIDREWVVQQRDNARTGSTVFPAYQEFIGLGDGRRVNLLHLVACALADGKARLEKVFGKPEIDPRRLPDVAVRSEGLMPADIAREAKEGVIQFVLGPVETIEPGDEARLNDQFTHVQGVVADAFHQDHDPYHASGTTYAGLVELIRKELKLEGLLLIFPGGGVPEPLLTDYIRVLKNLGRIFDAVQAGTTKPTPGAP